MTDIALSEMTEIFEREGSYQITIFMPLCQHVLGKFSRFVLFHILDRNLLSWINFKRLLIPYPQSLPLPYSIPIL